LAAGVVFYVVSQITDLVWNWLRLPLMDDWPVAPYLVLSFILTIIAGIVVRKNDKVNIFLNEVVVEMVKVTWPNKNETIASAGVVVVLTIIVALLLLFFDTLWGTITKGFLT